MACTDHSTNASGLIPIREFGIRMVHCVKLRITQVWLMCWSASRSATIFEPRMYLLLMAIFFEIIFVLILRYPIRPSVVKGSVVNGSLVLQFKSKICVDRQNECIEPTVAFPSAGCAGLVSIHITVVQACSSPIPEVSFGQDAGKRGTRLQDPWVS